MRANIWWLRSPYASNTSNFCNVNTNGAANNNNASNSYGLALGFNGCQKVAYLVARPVKIYDPSN